MARPWKLATLIVMIPLLAACQRAMLPLGQSQALPLGAQARQGWTQEQAEVALGLRLFFDPRLSSNNRVSCGSCHNPKLAFSDGRAVGIGVDGRTGTRNTPTILQAKESPVLFWDGRAGSLEEQALGPLTNHVEMDSDPHAVVAKLSAIPMYPRLFRQAYGTGVSEAGVPKAIAAFERALQVGQSPYDRWQYGDDSAMSPAAIRGQDVFARKAHCGECHKGQDLTDHAFHNTGWGMDQPSPDAGRFNVTHDPADTGAFKTPTLYNIAETGPYFHDGRAKTLEEVVDFYNQGGLPNAHLDEKMVPIGLSGDEKSDLVEFLKALSAPNNFKELARAAVEPGDTRLPL